MGSTRGDYIVTHKSSPNRVRQCLIIYYCCDCLGFPCMCLHLLRHLPPTFLDEFPSLFIYIYIYTGFSSNRVRHVVASGGSTGTFFLDSICDPWPWVNQG